MSCSRGAAAPDRNTTFRLFAASAGYCQNPACHRPLFVSVGTDRIHIAEMAHILAASNQGPRAVNTMSAAYRGSFDNLILLCANCHIVIDKAPTNFPTPCWSAGSEISRLVSIKCLARLLSRSARVCERR